nr:ACT domain-containing protein [bacterium]
MTVQQISAFVENKAGGLADFARVLSDSGIDMRALSIAETRDFGIVRIIVDNAEKTAQVLEQAGYVCKLTPVLAVAIPDEPGSLYAILRLLEENGINLEYTYAFITRRVGEAYMVFRVADNQKAKEVLCKNNIRLISQGDLAEL